MFSIKFGKISRNLLYASFGCLKFLTLSQDVSNNACLKQLNGFSVKFRLYIHRVSYKLSNKYNWEVVRLVRLNYGTFKIAI